ncbi:hypothetical protein NMY22_g1493 [Coprinellus aureogranulatus]|nr:hypothetical protein NMY22_g1493 [Coprinellus aureogranulatus]
MSSNLPTEVLCLIIHEVAASGKGPWKGLLRDIKSCCTAAKVFVPLCQQYIFRNVNLQPSRTIMKFSNVKTPSTTALFIRLLRERPHLGVYVRNLKYLSSITVDTRIGIKDLLLKMPDVVEFYLDVEHEPRNGLGTEDDAVVFERCPRNWRDGVLSILTQPTLRKLSVVSLVIPGSIFDRSIGLVDLSLYCCWLGLDKWYCCKAYKGWRNRPGIDRTTTHIIGLQRIDADSHSLLESGVIPHTDGPMRNWPIDVSQVEELKLRVDLLDDFEHAELLFIRTQTLRKITLEIDILLDDELPTFPLARLHQGSFVTLTTLYLDFGINFETDGQNTFDPYLGLCERPLLKLVQLEHFKVDLHLREVIEDDLETIELARWRRLDEVVAPMIPGSSTHYLAFERLTDVSIKVQVSPSLHYPMFVEECAEEARDMVEYLRRVVSPDAYGGLIRLAKKELLKFSFVAEVVNGGD